MASTLVVTGKRSIGATSGINRTVAIRPLSHFLNSTETSQLSLYEGRLAYSYANASALARTAVGVVRSSTSPTTTLTVTANEPVVSVDWLHANLKESNLKMPHMLPSEEGFSAAISALGINNEDVVVVYDGKGIFSAARVWWMFRVFGHRKVWVLHGGLPKWHTSGYDVESSASGHAILKASPATAAIEKHYQGLSVGPITFKAKLQPHLLWTLDQIKRNIEEQTHQHVDARGKARFDGAVPEPRKGIRSGHVPGSKCIPFGEILDSQQTLIPESELAKRFEAEGISLDRHVVTSCGTGVTACILALGLYRLGKSDVPIYDGSWTEWASKSDTPVTTA